jgi:Bacterial toxin 30
VAPGGGVKLDDVATLLDQGIDADVVTKLIENKADLRDIAINVQILLDGGIRVDLVNGWLGNKTHLNDAIAIMNLGVDLNLIGTSSRVGNFTGLMGADPNEIVSRIPIDAKIEHWTSKPGKIGKGMKFKWYASGKTWRLEMHGPDGTPTLPVESNAAHGWVLRVRRGNEYIDRAGTFYKDSIGNPRSENYDPTAINDTHIPIQAP